MIGNQFLEVPLIYLGNPSISILFFELCIQMDMRGRIPRAKYRDVYKVYKVYNNYKYTKEMYICYNIHLFHCIFYLF